MKSIVQKFVGNWAWYTINSKLLPIFFDSVSIEIKVVTIQ